jgi:phage terminase large subunit
LRRRFEKTHRAVTEGVKFSHDELISLPSTLPLLRTLQKELSQPTMGKNSRMQLIVDKQPEGTRSPNLADAVVMAYWPVDAHAYDSSFAWV